MIVESARLPSVAILAHRGDAVAVALATLLRRRGRALPLLVDDAALATASYTHRPDSGALDAAGQGFPRTDSVALPGGAVIDAGTDLVLCRLSGAPAARQSTPAGQEYADAESFALLLSWLAGLGSTVVDRPSPLRPRGTCPDVSGCTALARRTGLHTPALLLTTNGAASRPRRSARRRVGRPPGTPVLPGRRACGRRPTPAPAAVLRRAGAAARQRAGRGPTVVGAPEGWGTLPRPGRGGRAAGRGDRVRGRGGPSEPVVLDLSPVPTACDAVQLTALAGWLETAGGQIRAGKEAA